MPISAAGLSEAEDQIRTFVDDLAAEAGRIAYRVGAEEASVPHVQRAAAHLYGSSRRRRNDVLTSVGGVVSGAGVSGAVSAALASPVTPWILIVAIVASLIGAVVLTVGLTSK